MRKKRERKKEKQRKRKGALSRVTTEHGRETKRKKCGCPE